MNHPVPNFDLILVGGGLQNGLIALSTLAHDPSRRIALIERAPRLGGNHTWCLHSRDVPEGARGWVAPLLTHEWQGYDVRFPGLSRTVGGAYCAVTSERFAREVQGALERAPGCVVLRGRAVQELGESSVKLEDGTELRADLVVDARGPERRAEGDGCGFQKFVGLELQFAAPHGVTRPVVMDATVPQLEGYRFFYVLPFGPDRLLIEDTRFSTMPDLDRDAVREQVRAYAARYGTIAAELREESGVLPMPYRGEPVEPQRSPLIAGYRGGFFHPATGYSFPAALRMAEHIATRPAKAVFDKQLAQLFSAHVTQARYAQRLNWLLFNGFEPGDMWNVFERFYRLPDSVIHRFYAMSLTTTDRARILIGRPPSGFKLGTAFKSGSARLEQGVQAALSAVRGAAPKAPADGPAAVNHANPGTPDARGQVSSEGRP